MTQTFQEFPKALYMGGVLSAECFVVFDAAEEQAKRSEGYGGLGESLEKSAEPKKRGRPRKVTDGTE